MRLTPEVIRDAPVYLNPIEQRELSLRGKDIVVIENLGVAKDVHECIDMCNNQIVKLENFPIMKRLETLMMSGNKIVTIAPGLGKSLPNLHTLLLENNQIRTVSDIESISELSSSLTHLTISSNPIVEMISNLRPILIALLPKLKVIDYVRVTQAEQELGASIRNRLMSGTPLDSVVILTSLKPVKVKLTGAQKKQLLKKLDAASTLAEMEVLEGILQTGIVPVDFDWDS